MKREIAIQELEKRGSVTELEREAIDTAIKGLKAWDRVYEYMKYLENKEHPADTVRYSVLYGADKRFYLEEER